MNQLITNNKQLDNHLDNIREAKTFSMDFEATNFESAFYDDRESIIIIGAAIAYSLNKERVVFWVPINHHKVTKALFDPEYTKKTGEPFQRVTERIPDQIEEAYFTKKIVELIEDESITWVNHNIKFDLKIVKNLCEIHLGRPLLERCSLLDSMASGYLLNLPILGLKHRAKVDLGRDASHFHDIVPEGKEHLAHLVSPELMRDYACDDAVNSLDLVYHHMMQMDHPSHTGKRRLLKDLEGPNISYLATMEHTGVFIDETPLKKAGMGFQSEMTSLMERFKEISGVEEDFNIRSTPQLVDLLFGKGFIKKLPSFKDQRGEELERAESTAKEYLREIIAKESGTPEGIELCRILLNYREVATLNSTFVISLLDKIRHSRTGRVHGVFKQFQTRTSRLSSADPNLQNIPVRSENGRLIRQAFVARDGFEWFSADYSQIEVRLLAHVSGCSRLRQIYREGLDIYKDVACQHYGVEYEDVTKDQRQNMKSVVLGRNYGLGAVKYAMQQMIPISTAKAYFKSYDERFPELKQYSKEMEAYAKKYGYVKTLLGHTRSFKEDIAQGKYIGNAAGNLPIQGLASGVLKMAQKAIMVALTKSGDWLVNVYPTIQVHDELNYEIRNGHTERIGKIITDIMVEIGVNLRLSIPLEVSQGVGETWLDAH